MQDGITVKIKKLTENAVIPSYSKLGDAAMDLTATSKEYDEEKEKIVFGTGLAFEIPEGHVGLIFPRSSICKTNIALSNCVGVIDSGYRGEVKFFFTPGNRPKKNYEVGDRIGQIMIIPYPKMNIEEVQELSSTERGTGGFGSTGA
jgi:dUTP pyrophosphatase